MKNISIDNIIVYMNSISKIKNNRQVIKRYFKIKMLDIGCILDACYKLYNRLQE